MNTYLQKNEKVGPTKKVLENHVGRQRNPDTETLRLGHLLSKVGLQGKLTIGQSNDRYEQEADRVADRVMSAPDNDVGRLPLATGITPLIVQRAEEEEAQAKLLQRQEEEEEAAQPKLLQRQEEEEEMQAKLQRQPLEEEEEMLQPKGELTVAPVQLSGQINSIRGGGQPLPKAERAFFEPRFGVDFSNVRVHKDGQALQMARSVQARAFTVGRDVVFGAGQYAPGSAKGRKLLAHELTHVVQQRGGRAGQLQPFTDNIHSKSDRVV